MRIPSVWQWVTACLVWYVAVVVLTSIFLMMVGAFNEFSLAERLLWGPTMVMRVPYQVFREGLTNLWLWLLVHPLIFVPLLAFGLAALSGRRK